MAKMPGLFRRGGTYYLRVMVPKSLRQQHGGRSQLVKTLSTSEHGQARVRGAALRAQVLLSFQDASGNDHRLFGPTEFAATIPQRPRVSQLPELNASYLRTVWERWQASQKRSTDSLAASLRAVNLFEEVFGRARPLHLLSRADGDRFRAWLIAAERGTTLKTASDRLTWVKSLLKYACRELEVLPKNPWEGLKIDSTTAAQRRPWTQQELQLLFGQPLHQNFALPDDPKAGEAAAYWIPLLGLFQGARISELAQLRVNDVVDRSGTPLLRFSGSHEGQKLKTEASARLVPIHSELLRLGFLEYVANVEKSGEVWLWPRLPKRSGKAGGFISQWFGAYRRSLGLSKYPDFHCFRHTVRSQLAEAGVAEPLIDTLLGHEIKGSTGAKVYTHRSLASLTAAVAAISYPELELKKQWPSSREATD